MVVLVASENLTSMKLVLSVHLVADTQDERMEVDDMRRGHLRDVLHGDKRLQG